MRKGPSSRRGRIFAHNFFKTVIAYCSIVVFLLFVGMYGDTSMPISKEQMLNDMICDLDLMKFLLKMISKLAGLTLEVHFLT